VEKTKGNAVVLFDGVCNLCNGAVQFVLRRDRHAAFRFASLQSNYAKDLMKRFGLIPGTLHSLLLYDNGVLYEKSDAALRIASYLKGFSVLSAFKIVPRFIRDGVYDFVARNRYRIFGKRDECMIPTPETKGRFIE
jgi:predicted DCC family thiol-disulfide oxidoreductase YuxK